MLEAYEWNAMIPLPTAAELLATTPQTLLTVLANQAHRIDGDHPVFGKKHPVMVYFFADDCDPAYPVPVVGRPDGPNKRFLFALAANGAAQLPPPFDSPPRTVKRDEACLMAYIVQRLRDLMAAPTPEAPVPFDQAAATLGGTDPQELLARLHSLGALMEEVRQAPDLVRISTRPLLRPVANPDHYLDHPDLRTRLFVKAETVRSLADEAAEEQEIPATGSLPAEAPEPPARRPDRQPGKKGGRPKTQLRLGVEALYRAKLAAGQTDILLPGNVEMFMLELRRIIKNGEGELFDKIKEHIEEVSKPSGQWVVRVQAPPDTGGKVLRKNEKPEGYDKKAVSNYLSDLRKEYPVE